MRVLIVRTDRIGDVVLATPLIRALRKSFPEAHLAALVRPYSEPALRGNPHLDQILLDDTEGRHAGSGGTWRLARDLASHRFTHALLLLPTKRLAYALFLAGIPRRVGVGRRLYQVLTGMSAVRRFHDPLRSEADYCLDLGRRIGAADDGLATEAFLTDTERRLGEEILSAGGIAPGEPIVGLHPGSGGSAPNWPPEAWARLASVLGDDPDVRVVLTGGESERALLPAFEGLRYVDLVGRLDLRGTMAVIAACDVFLSASTGTMHLAGALGVPTVSPFCPLPACHPDLWGPHGNVARNLLPPPGACGRDCPGDPKRCRFEGGPGVEEAIAAAREILRTLPPTP
ncbi:MAG: glycosyltransferase family 9 protein [Gemmatimonadetes bacterium]|nr:glycosyltransferase family 9 protein [Gemmatimonadota bacterium]